MLVWDGDIHVADRLKQYRTAICQSILHRQYTGALERHVGAVNCVVLSVEQIDHRKTEQDFRSVFLHTRLDRWDRLVWHHSA